MKKEYLKSNPNWGFCPNHKWPDCNFQIVTHFYKNHFIPICDKCHERLCGKKECYE